jgi:hypothetical protein
MVEGTKHKRHCGEVQKSRVDIKAVWEGKLSIEYHMVKQKHASAKKQGVSAGVQQVN